MTIKLPSDFPSGEIFRNSIINLAINYLREALEISELVDHPEDKFYAMMIKVQVANDLFDLVDQDYEREV